MASTYAKIILFVFILPVSLSVSQTFTPVIDPTNDAELCAIDPPNAVLSVADASVGIPSGVPDIVVCGYGCANYYGCSSFNWKKQTQDLTSATCEFYTYEPIVCVVASPGSCQYLSVSGQNSPCLPVANRFTVIGCYEDHPDARDLSAKFWRSSLMTLEICSQFCFKQGFKYAGIQDSSDCYCDNSYDSYNPSSICNSICSGNSNEKCGGYLANTIISVCDRYCAGSCTTQGPGLCDSQCVDGYRLLGNFTCKQACPASYQYLSHGYAGITSGTCFKMQTSSKTRSDAADDCRLYSQGYLARFDGAVEENVVENWIVSHGISRVCNAIWIGGCRTSDGSFVWSENCADYKGPPSGQTTLPISYQPWGVGEPNNYGTGEWCLETSTGVNSNYSSFAWNDNACSSTQCYLCEVDTIVT